MKLGLKIEITSQGAGSAAKTYNSTPALEKYASASRSFIKEVFPAREDLKLKGMDPSSSLDESARSVVFFRFLGPEGYLICVFQARPENSGRPYDGAAAWIHVPASVKLSGGETEALIDEVDAALSGERGIDYSKLDALFTREYEQKTVLSALSTIGSNGPTAGIRYYGVGTDFQLSELLGNNIAQQVYGKYRAVFVLRKNDGMAVSAPEISTPLSQTCIVSAPSSVSGYTAFFENGMPFNVDLEYPQNAPLTIVWKKAGYQDIVKRANARGGNANETAKLFVMNKSEIKVAVKKQIFRVIGDSRILSNYQIFLDGAILKDVLYVPEEKLVRGINVKVVADGFKTYTKDHMLGVDTKQVDIQLKRLSFVYEFAVPMYSHGKRIQDGRLTVELNKKLEDCPIKGYSLMRDYINEGEGNTNRIKSSGTKDAIKHFAYGFITCMMILALWSGWQALDKYEFNLGWPPFQEVKQQPDNIEDGDQQNPEPIENKDSLKLAVSYLEDNDTWHKDSLDKYEATRGMFEELNEFRQSDIIERGNKLGNIKKLKNIVDAFMNNSYDHHIGKEVNDGKYNSPTDKGITVKNYIGWISEKHSPVQKKTESSSTQANTSTQNTGTQNTSIPNTGTQSKIKEGNSSTKKTETPKEQQNKNTRGEVKDK